MPTVTRVLLQLHLAFCSECNLYTTVMLGHCRRLVVILLFCKGQNWGPVEGQIMRLEHQQQTSQHADAYTYLLTRENRYSRSFHCRSTIHSAIFTRALACDTQPDQTDRETDERDRFRCACMNDCGRASLDEVTQVVGRLVLQGGPNYVTPLYIFACNK